MMCFLNIINDIAESNAIFTILIVILIVTSLLSLYLIYTQNKINSKNISQNYFDDEEKFKHVSVVEELVTNDEGSVDDLDKLSCVNEDVDYSLSNIENLDNSVFISNDSTTKTDINDFIKDESKKINYDLETDAFDLEGVTRELETIPRERTINLTPFEAAQEESAIISYDELINRVEKNRSVSYNNIDNFSDYNTTANVLAENDKNSDNLIENELNSSVTGYEHEEAFLDALKQLQKLLN